MNRELFIDISDFVLVYETATKLRINYFEVYCKPAAKLTDCLESIASYSKHDVLFLDVVVEHCRGPEVDLSYCRVLVLVFVFFVEGSRG